MKTHAERFRHLLEVWGLTQEELGILCGIKRGTVGTIVNGKTTPDGDVLANLLRSKPDLNPDWLLTGTGPMLRDGRQLTPLPADPAPAKVEAGPLVVVAESEEVRRLKQDNQWLREQLSLWQRIATSGGVDLTRHAATGTDASFNLDAREAVGFRLPNMFIHREESVYMAA